MNSVDKACSASCSGVHMIYGDDQYLNYCDIYAYFDLVCAPKNIPSDTYICFMKSGLGREHNRHHVGRIKCYGFGRE